MNNTQTLRLGRMQIIIQLLFFVFLTPSLLAQYENVVLNETSGDGGNIEARNDAIVELAGPPGTDIGCMVITDTEWAVVLPAGTQIPADGVFLIGCGAGNNGGNASYTSGSIQSGLSCHLCDFPGLVVDFDVCDARNENYISASMNRNYGFTLDNIYCRGNRDGEQVILFRPDGTPHDAAYWGAPDLTLSNGGATTFGGSSGGCGSGFGADHVSVQIGVPYTLGDNDNNGIINDYTGSHIGFRADGGNATGVNIMPSGNDDFGNPVLFGMQISTPPGDCNADQKLFTVPSLDDPIWVDVGLTLVSCNSTHIRINDTSPVGNSEQVVSASTNSSHMDDPDLNMDWISYIPTALTPSSIDPVAAAMQWQVTNHPNPGQPNDADSWDFFVDTENNGFEADDEITEKSFQSIVLCEPQSLDFQLQVFNYQHVEPVVRTMNKAGSYINDESGTDQPWTIVQVGSAITDMQGSMASAEDGITTLQYSTGILPVGQHEFELIWDDYTDCCGSGNNSTVTNSSNPHECYEKISVQVEIVDNFVVTQNTVECPTDFQAGTINISNFTSGGYQVQYELFVDDMAFANPPREINTSGVFSLPTNIANTDIRVRVTSQAPCDATEIVVVNLNCIAPPICPESYDIITGSTIANSPLCPGDNLTLCFSGDMLPYGGQVIWTLDETSEEIGVLPIEIPICPTVVGAYINACNEGNGEDENEYVVIRNGSIAILAEELSVIYSTPTRDLTASILGADDVGAIAVVDGFNADCPTSAPFILSGNGETIPADATILLMNGESFPDFDFDFSDVNICNSTIYVLFGDGGWRGGGTFVNNDSDDKFFTTSILNNTACTGTAVSYNNNITNFNNRDGQAVSWSCAGGILNPTGVFEGNCGTNAASGHATLLVGGQDISCATSTDGSFSGSLGCITYQLPVDVCNSNPTFRATLTPFPEDCPDNTSDEDSGDAGTLSFNVTCPSADLVPFTTNQCVGDGAVNITVNLNGLTTGNYCLTYIDATANPQTITVPATANGMTTATIIIPDVSTDGEKDIFLTNVFADLDGDCSNTSAGECMGTIDFDAATIQINEAPTGQLIAATDLEDCDRTNDPIGQGSLTFEFTGDGVFIFQYTINDGDAIEAETDQNTFIFPAELAGTYELISVTNDAGCTGSIGATTIQTVQTPNPVEILSVTAENATICTDNNMQNATTVDLATTVDFSIDLNNDNNADVSGNYNEINADGTSGMIKWYSTDAYPLGSIGRQSVEITGTNLEVSPPQTQNYYFIYTHTDGCEASSSLEITVNETPNLTANINIANTCPTETVDLTNENLTGLTDNNTATNGSKGTISYHTISNPIDQNDNIVSAPKMAATDATYYIRKEVNGCADIVAIQAMTSPCPQCPVIGDFEISTTDICSGDAFVLVASDLEMMAQSENNQANYGIRFIAYPPNVIPVNPYTDTEAMTLGIVPFSQLTNNNSTAILTDVAIDSPTGNYQIFAILAPTPTLPEGCHPARGLSLNIKPIPQLVANATITNACPATTVDLTNTNVTSFQDNNSETNNSIGTISYHTISNPIDENDNTVSDPNMATTGVTYYIRKEVNGCADIVAIQVTTSACPQCPVIGDFEISATDICSGDAFVLVASDLEMMAQSENNQANYGIRFIAYPPNVIPANPYTDTEAMTLGIVPFSQLTNNNSTAILTDVAIDSPTGNYQIFAILAPIPTLPEGCRPTQMLSLTVKSRPNLSVNSPIINTCPSEIVDLTDTQITGFRDNNASTSGTGTISYHTIPNPQDANDNIITDPTMAAAGQTYYIRKETNDCTDIVEIVVDFTSCVMCPVFTDLSISTTSICRNESIDLTIEGLAMFDFNSNAQTDFGLRIITYPIGIDVVDLYTDSETIELTSLDYSQIQNNTSVTLTDVNINLEAGDYILYTVIDPMPSLIDCRPFQLANLEVRSRPEEIILPAMACNEQINISLSRNCDLFISVDALLETPTAQANTFYTIEIDDQIITIGDAINGTTAEDLQNGFALSMIDTGLVKYNITRCTELLDCDEMPLVIKDNCWGNIFIEDKSNPFCNLQLDEERLVTFDANGDGIIDEDETLINDPSGVDDLQNEYILCNLIERNGVNLYFDELEANDIEIDYNGDEIIDQVLLGDFTDCSGIESISITDQIIEVCDLNDLNNFPIDNARFNIDSFEITTIYQRTWHAIDSSGMRSNDGCSQFVFALRPKFLQLDPVITIDCDSMLLPNAGAPFFTVLNNKVSGIENGGQGSDHTNVYPITTYSIGYGENSCGYTVSNHIDPQIPICTNSYKQNRHWSVVDWCDGTRLYDEFTQVLKVEDSSPPILISENGFPLFVDAAGTTRENRADNNMPPYSIDLGTQLFDCTATGHLPQLALMDNCGTTEFTRITIERNIDENTFNLGDIFINNFLEDSAVNGSITDLDLPTGSYTVAYFFTDDCGNASTLEIPLNLTANHLPLPICNDELVITLLATDSLNDQRARVYAEDLNDTSRGTCFPLIAEVRLGDGSNQPWSNFVEFTCADAISSEATATLKVELRITEDRNNNQQVDANELSNTCWSYVRIEDKTPPRLKIRDTLTLNCNSPILNNLQLNEGIYSSIIAETDELFPTVLGGCTDDGITLELEEVDLSAYDPVCRVGVLSRTFRASRMIHGNEIFSNSVQQFIRVSFISDWFMIFPTDLMLDCQDVEQADVFNQTGAFKPLQMNQILNNFGCDPWEMRVEDEIFDISGQDADGACFKIIRNYIFINFCTYDPTNSEIGIVPREEDFFTFFYLRTYLDSQFDFVLEINDAQEEQFVSATEYGFFKYRQIIKVKDDIAPIILPIEDFEICDSINTNDNCTLDITFPLPEVQECKDNFQVFWELDAFQTGNFSISGELSHNDSGALEPLTLDAIPYGKHAFRYRVIDGCENSSTTTFNFTVKDCKAPTAYCHIGVNIDIMPTGMVCVWASDLDAGSFDDCSEPVQLSFSPNPLDTGMKFTCSEIGSNSIILYVTDTAGNQSTCRTVVNIQTDLPNECSNGASIRGKIYTEIGDQVEEVMVRLKGQEQDSLMSNLAGDYAFLNLPIGVNYSITPYKNTNPLNGVSTFDLILIKKHIMGLQLLDSPYKLIAADINRNGTISTLDIVQMQRLIMGVDSSFTNNNAWRFVAADYEFPNPSNPWLEEFPESIFYENMNTTTNELADFIAIKIGDVNHSAILHNLIETEERNTITDSNFISLQHSVPSPIELYQNIPNPFSESTTIGFNLPTESMVQINIQDINGSVILWKQDIFKAGFQQIEIDETVLKSISGGVYFYTLKAGDFIQTRKMILQK